MSKLFGIFQDGADFYFEDDEGNCRSWTAPIKVTDHDTKAAKLARQLFLNWCEKNNYSPIWEK